MSVTNKLTNTLPESTQKILAVLAIAGFAGVITTRLCDAMLPALAAAFTVSSAEASIVIWAFSVTYGLMQLVYGPLGDRFGKPRVIALATGLCALASLAAAAASTLPALALARAAIGASAAAIVPLALAWIGDTVPVERRQIVLARYSGATVSGIMLGAWAGGFLTETLGWRATFLSFVPLFLVVAAVLWNLDGKERSKSHIKTAYEPYRRQLMNMLRTRRAQVVFGGALLEAMFVFGFLAFLPTVVHTQFAMSLSYGGAVLAGFGLGGLGFSRVAHVFVRSMTTAAQARIGSGVLATGYAMLAWMPHWSWAISGCLVAGFGFYTLHNTFQYSALQLSATSRGLGVSLFASFLFLGQSLGVILAANIFSLWGASWSFTIAGAALTIIGLTFAHLLESLGTSDGR